MAAKDNDDHKPGLKLSLGYLLKKAASMLKAQRIINQGIDNAQEVGHVLCVLKLHWDSIIKAYSIATKLQSRKAGNQTFESRRTFH